MHSLVEDQFGDFSEGPRRVFDVATTMQGHELRFAHILDGECLY